MLGIAGFMALTLLGCYADSFWDRVFTDQWNNGDMTPAVRNGYFMLDMTLFPP